MTFSSMAPGHRTASGIKFLLILMLDLRYLLPFAKYCHKPYIYDVTTGWVWHFKISRYSYMSCMYIYKKHVACVSQIAYTYNCDCPS